MDNEKFINEIYTYVKKYAPDYDIKVYSPIIAQSILESNWGKSELVLHAYNYFGLKYKPEVAHDYYIKIGSEQNSDGSYTSSVMKWCKFHSTEEGVKGYFDFISNPRYANLKGVTDPNTYLTNIKKDGYATSIKYVDNLMNVINKYNLTKYDPLTDNKIIEKEGNKMRINVHAGHNPDGKVACGAVGLIKESTEARKVKDKLISILKSEGHTVYDCTVDNGTSQSDVLKKIVDKCNSNSVDIDVSIHFNSGAKDLFGNKKTTGTEVFIYNASSKAKTIANRIVNKISGLGFTNRGLKTSTTLYFLRKTKSPAVLVECCFVDDKDDVSVYNADSMAKAIAEGILNINVDTSSDKSTETVKTSTAVGTNDECPFVIKCLDYLNIRDKANGNIVIKDGCRKGTKYTIIQVSGNWGKLKSKAGWINISSKYVTRA